MSFDVTADAYTRFKGSLQRAPRRAVRLDDAAREALRNEVAASAWTVRARTGP